MSLHRRTFCMSALAVVVASAMPRSAHAAAPVTLPSDSANRQFSVLYKGDRIGRHIVRSTPIVEGIRVNTEVDLTVKRFFVTMFSYRHRSEEVWRDGRLMALKSETTDDGVTFRVDGAAVPRGFRVVGNEGPFVAAAATLTSNCLWNHAILQQETMIDAQRGGVIGLSVRRLADDDIVIAGRSVAATRFRLITPDLAGTIWYDRASQWVSGELERSGGTLQYRLEA
jgi:transposase InsO family protein